MDYKNLTDRQLVSSLIIVARQEREVLIRLLGMLREMERRKLYLDLGFSSLFVFCVKELGYSEAETMVRIQAMRLTMRVPEAEVAINEGRLTLTVAADVQSCFRREEIKKDPVPVEEQKKIVEELCGVSTREAEKKLAERFPGAPPRERVQMLSGDKVRIEFVVDGELWKKIEELQCIRSHVNPFKRWDLFLKDLIMLGWKKWNPLAGVDRSPGAPLAPMQQSSTTQK